MDMTNNKQQLAVEWLFSETLGITLQLANKRISHRNWELQMVKLYEQAKEMEKEQRSIEVPSDEEIGKEASVRHYGTNFKHVFASGAKWMRNKIQGGDQ
jgi:stalled ribosome rescue protein Dom34